MTFYKSCKPAFSLATVGAALCLAAGPSAAQSSYPGISGVRLSGFGTVGVAHAQAPAGWGFRRSIEQPSSSHDTRVDVDSRLGVQLNYAASSRFELVGQLVAVRRTAEASDSDAIEWAFAAYRPTADLSIRAGRLNLDQFVMSDYRNVGFGYLYARPPVEYYGSIPSNLDGADISQSWTSGDVRWRAKGFGGRSKTRGLPLTGAFGVALTRESGGLVMRAGWSRAKLEGNGVSLGRLLAGLDQIRALPIPSVAAEAATLRNGLDLAARPLVYATVGLSYEQEQWQYAAELTRLSVGNSNVHAGYASLGRRFGELTVFGMVSGARSSASPVATPAWGASLAPVVGPAAAQQAQQLGALAAYAASQSIRQTTVSLGGRWDIHPRVALKLQWDHVKIRPYGGFLWSQSTAEAGRANVATVLIDFVF